MPAIFIHAFMLIFCLTSLAHAEDGLRVAVHAAITNHPTIEAAQSGYSAQNDTVSAERAGYFPTLNVNAAGGRLYADTSTTRGLNVTRGAGYSNIGEASVTLVQPLFNGLGTTNRMRAEKMRRDAALLNVQDRKEQIALRAASSYISMLSSTQALAELDVQKTIEADYRTRIEDMVAQGGGDESESAAAIDIQTLTNITAADIHEQAMAARAEYIESTGLPAPATLSQAPRFTPAIPATPELAIEKALMNNPQLQIAAVNARASEFDANATASALSPEFTSEVSYLKRDQDDLIGGETTDARGLLRMNWDISLGGAQLARIRAAKHEHQQAMAEKQELARQIARDVSLSYSFYQKALAQADLYKQRIEIYERLAATSRAQFEGGQKRLIDLLQVENQLFNARLAYINGYHTVIRAEYTVLAAMGQFLKTVDG